MIDSQIVLDRLAPFALAINSNVSTEGYGILKTQETLRQNMTIQAHTAISTIFSAAVTNVGYRHFLRAVTHMGFASEILRTAKT